MTTRSKADYLRCAAQGLTQAETARRLGVSREAVSQMARRHAIEFRPAPQNWHADPEAREQSHHFGCPGDDRDRSNDP